MLKLLKNAIAWLTTSAMQQRIVAICIISENTFQDRVIPEMHDSNYSFSFEQIALYQPKQN